MNGKSILAALILAVGIAAAGWWVGDGFYKGRATQRVVTVKGVAERDVTADVAMWPLRYTATNDDLLVAQRTIEESRAKVLEFLKANGLNPALAQAQRLAVVDRLADQYRSGPIQSRYIVTQTLMVRSDEPGKVRAAAQKLGDLLASGVVLSTSGGPDATPTYLFTRLNEFKPQMIAEATAEARKAAEQFARDSGSRIGRIVRASQGVFVVLPRDRAPGVFEGQQIDKTLRVVSTIVYALED